MQLFVQHLLAARGPVDDDTNAKPIFIAMVVIIWIISSIVSSVRKATAQTKVKKEKAQLRSVRQAIQLPAIAQSRPRAVNRGPVPIKKTMLRRPPPVPKRAPAPPPADAAMMMQQAQSPTAQPQATSHAKPSSVSAAALNRWLNPKTLRQQFMLTEILQPPVAFRESHLQ